MDLRYRCLVPLLLAPAAFAQPTVAFKLYGLAFSPYEGSQNPSTGPVNLDPAQIERRLNIVAPFTQAIRIYGCGDGLGATAGIARAKGLQLVIGASLGTEHNPTLRPNGAQLNRVELDCAIANAQSGDILAVGNETLLRSDLNATELIGHIQYAKARVRSGVRVSTVETWDVLIQNWQVIREVDLLMANIFPYWESAAIDQSLRTTANAYYALVTAANGKEVIIAETGWPSDGPARGAAVPSIQNASTYFLSFVSWARARNVKYFYFEAFDELWKGASEPVGSHWGVWDRFGNIKAGMQAAFDTSIPVPPPPLCESVANGNQGPPSIAFTYIPPLDLNTPDVEGRAGNVIPANHRVSFYIKAANGLWYIKPTLAQPLTAIRCDGTFTVKGIEAGATEVRAFLFPNSFTPPDVFGAAALPQILFDNDVADPASAVRGVTSLSGSVKTRSVTPLPGVQVNLTLPFQATATTSSSGNYSFPSLPAGSHITVAPSAANLVFTPSSISYSAVNGAAAAHFVTDTQPCVPSLPVPADDSGNAAPGGMLLWKGCEEAASYDIYLDTSATPRLAGTSTTQSFTPSALSQGNKYYWKVVARNSAGASSSPVWSFVVQTSIPTPGSGLVFYPVTPCRIVDTRTAAGTFGGPVLAAGTSRDFPLPLGACPGLANAQAYSLNITVVPREPLAFLTLWPAGLPRPVVSTLNSFEGKIKANAAIVPAGQNGAVSVFVTNATDVIIDINGYFAGRAGSPLTFFPVTPCRAADTRLGGGRLTGSRNFPLRGVCGLPSNAEAYSLNATVVPAAGLSYLTLWPGGSGMPVVSTLNALDGSITANAAIVPAGPDGSINAFTTDSTDLILDVNGYFARADTGLSFYRLVPCRLVDTRPGAGTTGWFGPSYLAAGTSRSFPVPAGRCGVPPITLRNTLAYSGNVTVVPAGPLAYVTLWPSDAARPLVSTLNSFQGQIVSNAVLVPAAELDGGVSAFATDKTEFIFDLNGYFAP